MIQGRIPVWTALAFLLVLPVQDLCASSPVSPMLQAGENDGVRIDPSKVRFGDVDRFDPAKQHKVGTVRSTEFYEATKPVKTIRQEGIEPGTARYKQLMKEATAIYKRTLTRAAQAKGLVLIVEEGGITGYRTEDVTAFMIQYL